MSLDHSIPSVRLCEFPGCDRPYYARGVCKSHCSQLWNGKPLTPLILTARPQGTPPRTDYDEIPCQTPGLVGPCHVSKSRSIVCGYATAKFKGKSIRLHRYVFELAKGSPIADGMMIDHMCRVKRCINPAHLREVTPKINSTENIVRVQKTHCPQGHEYNAENTKIRRGAKECKVCHRNQSKSSYHRKRKS